MIQLIFQDGPLQGCDKQLPDFHGLYYEYRVCTKRLLITYKYKAVVRTPTKVEFILNNVTTRK